MASETTRMPTWFIGHGAGPSFFVSNPMFEAAGVGANSPLANFLRSAASSLPRQPKAILVISAHWETPGEVQVYAHDAPGMLYDYLGFDPEAYQIQYPAPGCPEVADRVLQLLSAAGIKSGAETKRGYDHGTFIPLKVVFPEANIPIVQLSLREDLDPKFHVDVGRALTPLRDENVLIVGSGFSVHNMGAFRSGIDLSKAAKEWDDWLTAAMASPAEERNAALAQWKAAPNAEQMHPREEHLMPLMVAAGAAGDDAGSATFQGNMANLPVSCYGFGV